MSAVEVAQRHQARQAAAAAAVAAHGADLWGEVNPDALSASWAQLLPRLMLILTAAQRTSAASADPYTDSVLAELGVDVDPEGQVAPRAFAGESASGAPLPAVLTSPVITTKQYIDQGADVDQALQSGGAQLDMILRTEVADAGRTAGGVAVVARPTVGYVRQVTPPSCPRCVILAGRFYRYNRGFLRHPNCDCRHIPAPESVAGDLTTDPKRLFDEGQIRGLSKADAQAIRDGADISQVVNAHRGMYTAGGRKFTTEGTTRRGVASRSRRLFGQNAPLEATSRSGRRTARRIMRPRPEQIYKDATSRQDAIRLLKLYGYLG